METWKRNLWILWTTQVISLMSFGFGLPFIPIYIKELGVVGDSQLNLYTTILAATPALTMGIMAPIWGNLADRYGRKLMILRAMFFAVFIISAMGLVSNVYQLIGLRLMQGLFTGTVTAAMTFVAANTPKKQMTHALGVITSSTFIGYSIGPMLGGFVADVFSTRVSFFIGGLLMLIGGLLVLFLVKEDKSTLATKKKTRLPLRLKYKNVLLPSVIVILMMLFFLRMSRTIFSPYLARFLDPYIADDGTLASVTGLLTGVIGFATAFSSLIMGRIASRLNKMRLMSVLVFVGLLIMIAINYYEAIALKLSISNDLIVFFALYILFYIVIGGVEPIVTSTSALQVEASDRGALFGLQGMIGSLAWFVAPALAGPITVLYPLKTLFVFVPIFMGLILLLSFKLNNILKHQDAD